MLGGTHFIGQVNQEFPAESTWQYGQEQSFEFIMKKTADHIWTFSRSNKEDLPSSVD